jgi:hypothetical protein
VGEYYQVLEVLVEFLIPQVAMVGVEALVAAGVKIVACQQMVEMAEVGTVLELFILGSVVKLEVAEVAGELLVVLEVLVVKQLILMEKQLLGFQETQLEYMEPYRDISNYKLHRK